MAATCKTNKRKCFFSWYEFTLRKSFALGVKWLQRIKSEQDTTMEEKIQ